MNAGVDDWISRNLDDVVDLRMGLRAFRPRRGHPRYFSHPGQQGPRYPTTHLPCARQNQSFVILLLSEPLHPHSFISPSRHPIGALFARTFSLAHAFSRCQRLALHCGWRELEWIIVMLHLYSRITHSSHALRPNRHFIFFCFLLHCMCLAYMAHPCHIEVILSQQEEVSFFQWRICAFVIPIRNYNFVSQLILCAH
jgi:hypothetical protein